MTKDSIRNDPESSDGEMHMENAPDWLKAAKERSDASATGPSFLSPEEAQKRSAKIMEDYRAAQEAELEKARLKQGSPIPPKPTDPETIVLEWAMPKHISSLKLKYLVDPFLPAKCVVGFFGRGSTAKSSFLATLAAKISEDWTTLWISVEELTDWITQRHLRAGGQMGTLAAFAYTAIKRDSQGRVIGSTFDVYRDLESTILKAKAGAESHYSPPRPLRLVVLDTAVGLTTWGKGESPNDDGSVKRLLAYLQALAETYDLCIAIIGHSNKGKHDYFADTVAGSSAWTNSPRLSFVHARDRREDHGFVMRVAKSNLSSAFGVAYSTEPVLVLHQHEDGHASVMCKVNMEQVIWGDAASLEMYEDAVRKPDEEGDSFQPLPTIVEKAIVALVELVLATPSDGHITRDDVHWKLGKPIGRREWVKVDGHMQGHPAIAVERGPQNKVLYRRRS